MADPMQNSLRHHPQKYQLLPEFVVCKEQVTDRPLTPWWEHCLRILLNSDLVMKWKLGFR